MSKNETTGGFESIVQTLAIIVSVAIFATCSLMCISEFPKSNENLNKIHEELKQIRIHMTGGLENASEIKEGNKGN